MDFPLFPDFPNVMRHMIWEASLPEPRIMLLRQDQSGRRRNPGAFRSLLPLPIILSVNRESRYVARLFYTHTLSCTFYEDSSLQHREYLNFRRDTANFDLSGPWREIKHRMNPFDYDFPSHMSTLRMCMDGEEVRNISNLALKLDWRALHECRPELTRTLLFEALAWFGGVKSLTLVLEHY